MWTTQFWKATVERAVKTAAQAALATFGGGVGFFDVDWQAALSMTLIATLTSVLTSITVAGATDGNPSLNDAEVLTTPAQGGVMAGTTQSGYPVIDDYGDPMLVSNPVVPGTDVKVLGGLRRGDVATILLYVGERWNATVEPLVQEQGIWGYGKRNIRGGSGWSNHAGGAAVDYNAAIHGQGGRTMSEAQIAAVRAIINEVNDLSGGVVIDWGGEWGGSTRDEMHVQMHGNVSQLQVAVAANKIRNPEAPPSNTGEVMTLEEWKKWITSEDGLVWYRQHVFDPTLNLFRRNVFPKDIDKRLREHGLIK